MKHFSEKKRNTYVSSTTVKLSSLPTNGSATVLIRPEQMLHCLSISPPPNPQHLQLLSWLSNYLISKEENKVEDQIKKSYHPKLFLGCRNKPCSTLSLLA